jgi:hypothetical protein
LMAIIRSLSARWVKVAYGMSALACLALVLLASETIRFHPHYLLDGISWRRYLVLGPKLRPGNLEHQGARPIVDWLSRHAAPGSHIAMRFLNDASTRPFASLALAVTAFEVQRSSEAQTNHLSFKAAFEPKDLVGCDYVVVYPFHDSLTSGLSDFDEVYVARLKGVVAGRIFARRGMAPPYAPR